MIKRLKNSIRGRMSGIKNRFESRWQEYVQYYEDAIVWENTVLFESFGGKSFQGNPYYIFMEMLNDSRWREKDFYIAHQNPEKLYEFLKKRNMVKPNVHVIPYLSQEYRNVLCHAKYLINNMSFNMNFIKKDEQVYVNTWHGTPLKTLGRTINNDAFACSNAQRNMLMSDILLAPNELTRRVYEEDYMVSGIMPGQIIMGGYPRNTAFFNDILRENIRTENKLKGKKVLFYMPTWRGTASSGAKNVDFVADMERLANELGTGYAVYIKLHPAMSGSLKQLHNCKTMPEQYEVYEFLNACDVLITDYSSVYFDFANTGRQIILYQYDKAEYYAERGVYPEVEKNTPFAMVEDYEKLLEEVLRPRCLEYKKFQDEFCGYDGPDATKNLLRLMSSMGLKRPKQPVDLYVIDFSVTDDQMLKWERQLAGENYRFLFVPKRSNGRLQNLRCSNRLKYLALFSERNVRWYEFLTAYSKAMHRERKRLWGGLNINRVYSKQKRIPLFDKCDIQPWPEKLKD